MKYISLLIAGILSLSGCGASSTVSKTPIEKTEATATRDSKTVAAHSVEKEKETMSLPATEKIAKSESKTTWTRSGDPIDVSKFDEKISKAEKALKSDSNDSSKKAGLAEAFYDRGFALTQARQYASAVGDYRRALNYVPNHEESKKWMAMIQNIYKSMNREIPSEGEEPAPLEFKPEKKSS